MQFANPRRAALGVALIAATALVAPPAQGAFAAPPGSARAAATPVSVSVNARAGLATVPATALGVNDAIWDTTLGTDAVADLLGDAGVKMIRYPGGSYADIYHWETHTAPGGYVAPNTDFDTFMASARRTGAEPMIIANYGTGSAGEAAAWVRYANVTKGYQARYWTIGNENYGNGHYGSAWEADDHTDLSPTQYANEVVAYADAMKAVDPTIKVGAVLTMPANWPDGLVGTGDSATWNRTVLSIAGPHIDFADVHWYPGGGNAAEALGKTQYLDDSIYALRQQINSYGGADAGRLGISLTELNVGVGQNTQPGAIFLADAYAGLIANGVFTVQWWNVHNGIGTPSTVAGQTDYNDFGLLSSGNCTADNSVCEPPLNTPFAPYHALKLLSSFIHPGDQMIRAGTSDPLVTAHAARRPNGDLAVLLINKDPAAARDVALDYSGYTPSSAAPVVLTYGNGDTAIHSGSASTLPPYSLTLLTLKSSSGASPKAPTRLAASAVTDRTATISWSGGPDAAKYEIYRANGAVSEQLGETSGTSFTVHNLQPGRRYTVNVLARDGAGNQSWSSAPLTFTTGAPATSTCTVKFADTNDWGNGYVGQIDITNTGAAPLNGWTLAYTWPTTWQSVSSGWSATWTQTGTGVRVTSDATLAANGGTASVGFVGSYSGPNLFPVAFTLNGTLCSIA
ncbi:cellulose binding domain-containing protein [Paractinoplanes ferrugineus]|uniref:Alpha-L-arabinofuranosidase n=1 Tax=Paractinoplanes ferrugineus TaxID=113564 RepID=A0A919MBE2_9ACTN|nr:cellulose binding domain-containing protein [Actinoplanes ferrugineus]GIE09618.1 alpha-L-arabinofuranosidase [Actinoplanes ferrugineus]